MSIQNVWLEIIKGMACYLLPLWVTRYLFASENRFEPISNIGVGEKPSKVRLVCPLAQKWLWRHNRHVLKKCLHHLILVQFRFHLLVWWEILQFGHGFYLFQRLQTHESYKMTHFVWLMRGKDKNRIKAITDLSTGEIMYLIDDNGGSEIYYAQKTASVP